jgi:RHS repeat-associated protein
MTDASGKSYTWDFENRLSQAVVPGTNGGTTTFKYDPFGRRIYKQSPNFTSVFLYDGPNLIETTNGSGSQVASYTQSAQYTEGPLVDQPLAELRGSTTSYYQQDGLGSVTSLSSSAGVVANTYTYDSFGNTTASTGTLRNYFQYTGREFDSETGIYEYRARYYDPTAGRFLSEDPLGFKAGVDFYRYVRNQPVNFADPSGLYQLQGFTPQGAAQMSIAIGQLAAKLRSHPCCIDTKSRDRILDLLQPFGTGGITFVYKQTLPADPGNVTCAQRPAGWWAFLTNKIEVSEAAMDGTCACPLAGTILHEATHLTWGNLRSPTPEHDAYGNGTACFGAGCSMPPGLTTP